MTATTPDTIDFRSISRTSSSPFTDGPEPVDHPNHTKDGVGLSNAELGQKRRYALDLVNRLHNTGYVYPSLDVAPLTDFT